MALHQRTKVGRFVIHLFLLVLIVFGGQPVRMVQAVGPTYFVGLSNSGSGNCSSWINACTLQIALAGAVSGSELWVMKGTYTPGAALTNTFTIRSGVSVYGGFAGNETAREQRDPAANVTVLSGDIGTPGERSDNIYTVVTLSGTVAAALLDGVTVSGGNSNIPNGTAGGILNKENSSAVLQNLIVVDNSALSSGGGIFNDQLAHLTLTNVTVTRNSAYTGGGIYCSRASLNLTNVTIQGNTATNAGGGLSIGNNGDASLTNVTITNNNAARGGAIAQGSYSGVGLDNTIIWGNSAPINPQIYSASQSGTTLHDSIVQGGCPSDASCTNLSESDPRLGIFGMHGGALPTLPLLPGSPAIDSGNNSTCAAADARGITRPQGGLCDLGAFESRGFNLTLTGGDGQTTIVDTAFATPLSVAVSSSFGEPVFGGQVTFSGPASGAGIQSSPLSLPVPINGGSINFTPTANSSAGGYTVIASAAGASAPLTFNLTNLLQVPGMAIHVSDNPVMFAHPLTVTVAVQRTRTGGLAPTGTVMLYELAQFALDSTDAGRSLGTETLVNGTASFALAGLPKGSVQLVVVYSGDGQYQPSTSAPYTLSVVAIDTFLPFILR